MDLPYARTAAATATIATTGAQERRLAEVETAAREFEAVVLAQFLAPMLASVKTPSLAGGGKAESAYLGLLQEEYAKAIAARGGIGIADSVKAAMLELQALPDALPTKAN